MKIIFTLFLYVVTLLSQEAITPIPQEIHYDKDKARLGKLLFTDKRLSKDNTISCASCHKLDKGGADNIAFSLGINEQKGDINTPTVFNATFNIAQFWNGRAKDLEEQANGPIHNPVEMGSNLDEGVKKLKKDKTIVELFKKNYKDGVTKANIIHAIAEFEKALITPNSKFDQFLRGDNNALNSKEKEGYEMFRTYGCITCHNGINIGSNLYQKFGVLKDIKDKNTSLGRYEVTKDPDDKYYFKVPTLRNISKTAPYFHNGEEKELKGAIEIMGEYQLGRSLTNDEKEKIYLFLLTLTGETPEILQEEKQ